MPAFSALTRYLHHNLVVTNNCMSFLTSTSNSPPDHPFPLSQLPSRAAPLKPLFSPWSRSSLPPRLPHLDRSPQASPKSANNPSASGLSTSCHPTRDRLTSSPPSSTPHHHLGRPQPQPVALLSASPPEWSHRKGAGPVLPAASSLPQAALSDAGLLPLERGSDSGIRAEAFPLATSSVPLARCVTSSLLQRRLRNESVAFCFYRRSGKRVGISCWMTGNNVCHKYRLMP